MPFPPHFLFGTANADHQVEAYDPRREDVWDAWERTWTLVPRGRGTDFWNRYEDDIAAAAAMGCKLFRFSTAWARVETSEGVFDAEALAHYRRLAECIRGHGMKVMLTLHHFVWPVWLERDHAGMIGRRFPEFFTRYATRLAEALGDQVDYWITFNEPSQLTFGYIKPWWNNRYYMPPGMPRDAEVDEEAEAVGKLIPSLFLAHARARAAIKGLHPSAQIGVNPLVTGFPTWLQMLMDWGACHRKLAEALFKFTHRGALVHEKAKADLVIGGVTAADGSLFESSDPYLRTGKAVLVKVAFPGQDMVSLASRAIGVIGVGNQPESWRRDLPATCRKKVHANYDEARKSLDDGSVEAVYGDALYLLPEGLHDRERFRFLVTGLSDEAYVVLAPHGHQDLLNAVNRAVAAFRGVHIDGSPAAASAPEAHDSSTNRQLEKLRRRGRIRIGLRNDAHGLSPTSTGNGPELLLARCIAREVMGDDKLLEIVRLEPGLRTKVLRSKSSWLNWAWRFWGTTSLIANANWWYLGTSGRLPVELCPEEAVGAQDFVGLDYYWGLPTWKLHRFRSLEEAAHGRFIKAPVWPRGLFHALRRFHRWFPDQELFIVENGSVPVANGIARGTYLRDHLAEVEHAIDLGVPVRGYNCWSITSNREWGHAFDPNTDFGLYFVDLDKDPALTRVETPEVKVYRDLIAARTTTK